MILSKANLGDALDILPLKPESIKETAKRLEPFIYKTPVFTSTSISNLASKFVESVTGKPIHLELYFKAEVFQKSGAFKYRGANHALRHLTHEEKSKGVITHSSGNHAGALAKGSARNGNKMCGSNA